MCGEEGGGGVRYGFWVRGREDVKRKRKRGEFEKCMVGCA